MSITLNIIVTHPEEATLFVDSSPENKIKVEEYNRQVAALEGFVSQNTTTISNTIFEQALTFDNLSNFQSFLIFEQNQPIYKERGQYNRQNNIVGARTMIDNSTGNPI